MTKGVDPILKRLPTEASDSAKAVGLRYVSDDIPGFTRKRVGQGFRYLDTAGKPLHDPEHLKRIRSLAIPPAWEQVWICPLSNGHLQGTGRDARGRKQHRYHPRWREVRDETKFARMIAFAKALPGIRRRVRADLKRRGLPRRKVLAAVVRLLEVSHIRVGNEEYARENNSFGLTTMKNRHVNVNGSEMRFRFRGKAGKLHEISLEDRRLAKIVRSCQDLPGQDLFIYIDEDGKPQDLTSEHVNEYLREITGQDFTAKDFRTWAGTVLAAMALQEFEKFDSKAQARKNLLRAVESVAQRLGNTPSVCRKCYVHPAIVDSYLDGTMLRTLQHRAEEQLSRALHDLRPEEAAVLALLKERLASEANGTFLTNQLRASLKERRAQKVKAPHALGAA